MNYNSKTNEFTDVVKPKTKQLKSDVIFHKNELGFSVKTIADIFELSTTRIYQLLK